MKDFLYQGLYNYTPGSNEDTSIPVTAEKNEIRAQDIVVFMDAYDVLVFPHIRTVANSYPRNSNNNKSINNTTNVYTSAPIYFCSEYASYPELPSGWGNRRNLSPMNTMEGIKNESHVLLDSMLDSKYLNSGCYLGTAASVCLIYLYVLFMSICIFIYS